MKVALVVWDYDTCNFWRVAAKSLLEHHKRAGDEVVIASYHEHVYNQCKDASLVYLFNGEYDWLGPTRCLFEQDGKTVRFVELGWFQQQEHFYCDWRGTNGNCSLYFDDLSWLEPEDFKALDEKAEAYKEGLTPTNEGYVLVPLQVPADTTFKWSPLPRNGDTIRMAKRIFAGRKIIFRRHPQDNHHYNDMDIDLDEGSSLPIKELIMASDLVWGMNSTVLLESALLGKRTIAYARSFLDIGNSRREALAALVARQVPRHAKDLSPWMRRGRGLEHLANDAS